MPTAKQSVGREILEGLRQLKRGEHGRVTTVPSVATIREGTGLSQPRFAELLGVSVRTLPEWEQGRRAPSGAARTLLLIAAKNPGALLDVASAWPAVRLRQRDGAADRKGSHPQFLHAQTSGTPACRLTLLCQVDSL